jgi:hypothetical protein
MNERGRIGTYHWAEVPGERLQIKDVVRALGEHLRGLLAVNVSWDSGVLQELSPVPVGWAVRAGRVVSPPVDDSVLALWPQIPSNENDA